MSVTSFVAARLLVTTDLFDKPGCNGYQTVRLTKLPKTGYGVFLNINTNICTINLLM
jgi:hypothetical protein